MTPIPSRTDIEQFRSTVTSQLGLQYDDAKLDYLADVIRQRMQLLGRGRFASCSAKSPIENMISLSALAWGLNSNMMQMR